MSRGTLRCILSMKLYWLWFFWKSVVFFDIFFVFPKMTHLPKNEKNVKKQHSSKKIHNQYNFMLKMHLRGWATLLIFRYSSFSNPITCIHFLKALDVSFHLNYNSSMYQQKNCGVNNFLHVWHWNDTKIWECVIYNNKFDKKFH